MRDYLIDYLSSGPVAAIVFEGNEAIFITRKIVGATESRQADPSTIRGMYSADSYGIADSKERAVKNIVHASEDPKTAQREIGVWFKKSEIISYKRADEDSLY